jgi:(1->4)-alpha-D-glucan 1-alpha-D-glucosylmutase
VQQAISAAIQRNPKTETSIFHFVRDTLLADPNADATDEDRAARRRFAGKFQQLTSPATAKGIEDTAFYIYNRLLSLNEVGGNPCRFGVTPDELHAFFEQRQRDWPHTMSTLSTHDTKRSEDVRARLNVLSEMPGEWDECLQRWHAMNARHGATIDGEAAPDRNEEYALYQTLLGAWPLNEEELKSFKERVHAYMLKAMREAKVHTSWTDPNTQREAAIHAFVEAIMDPSQSGEFLGDFLKFQSRISHWGMVNSLSQTLIKLAAPGVPDTYQGTELWDFSLTDPDNRRPVDFARRVRLMSELREARQKFDPLSLPETGGIKLAVHRMALRCRSEFPGLFTRGRYLPLRAGGSRGAHVFAFARLLEGHAAVVAVPRLVTRLTNDSRSWPCGREVWGDTHITLPEIAGNRELRNVFTDQRIKARDASGSLQLAAADLFGAWPVALLVS